MATYTIELNQLIKQQYKLALDSYPIFDESYRETLNNKIIRHFWFREIGQETPDRFNFYLGTKMHEIMPYYNQLYESQLFNINPLEDVNISVDTTQTDDEEKTGNNTYNNTKTSSHNENGTVNGVDDIAYGGKDDYSENKTDTISYGLKTETSIDQTTTNDLATTTNNDTSGNGSSTTSGSKQNIYSDAPPNEIKTITRPDGTIETTSYATTTNNDTTRETSNTTTHEEATGSTKNTGTVKNVGTNNETKSGQDSHSINLTNSTTYGKTEKTTKNNTTTNTGTSTDESDGVASLTEKKNNLMHNVKTTKGHTKNQSELLKLYREILLNIDMLIIGELEPLFMGVF